MTSSAPSSRSYAGRTGAERAAERRARLVRATVEVLAGDGEAGATMTAICAEARLTERYFYESFGHRDEAMVAALDVVADEIAVRTRAAIDAATGEPETRLLAGTSAFVALVAEWPAAGIVAVRESHANAALRGRRRLLVDGFAARFAEESLSLFGDRAWPAARGRVQGLVFIAGFSELVAAWLDGTVDLGADDLGAVARDLFLALAVRPVT